MVLPHVPGHIPGGCRREHQQGVNDQQAHPGHGYRDHHGDGGGEHRLLPEHPHPPAVRQGRVDGGQHELIEGAQPQQYHNQKDHRQQGDKIRYGV